MGPPVDRDVAPLPSRRARVLVVDDDASRPSERGDAVRVAAFGYFCEPSQSLASQPPLPRETRSRKSTAARLWLTRFSKRSSMMRAARRERRTESR